VRLRSAVVSDNNAVGALKQNDGIAFDPIAVVYPKRSNEVDYFIFASALCAETGCAGGRQARFKIGESSALQSATRICSPERLALLSMAMPCASGGDFCNRVQFYILPSSSDHQEISLWSSCQDT
jgi:hypothetical protein